MNTAKDSGRSNPIGVAAAGLTRPLPRPTIGLTKIVTALGY